MALGLHEVTNRASRNGSVVVEAVILSGVAIWQVRIGRILNQGGAAFEIWRRLTCLWHLRRVGDDDLLYSYLEIVSIHTLKLCSLRVLRILQRTVDVIRSDHDLPLTCSSVAIDDAS